MSSTTPWPVGTNYRDSFTYNVTGLVDADFTKLVVRNGVSAATTGIVVTAIGSTISYDVAVSGSTGFPATAGFYQLVIYRTAIPTDSWSSEILVGTSGPTVVVPTTGVSFTSTTNDGRVTDGTSPLLNATVFILTPGGALWATLQTNINGNFGPVFLPAVDGTYALIVQLSGYTVGSASLVVSASGTVITGPGADITLTASTSANGVLASSLWAYARRQFQSRNGSMADQQVKESVNDALHQVCSMKDWPWLYHTGRVNFNGSYQTGTVTTTQNSAVVTLSGGTWPTWVANGEVYIAGQWQEILTRDSNTQITLVNAYEGATFGAGQSFIVMQWQYDLPADCRTVVNIINQNGWLWGPVPVSRWRIDLARQSQMYAAGSPSGSYIYAIEKDRLVVWPPPQVDLMVNVLYMKSPANLTTGTDVADWDPLQLEALYRSIDYQISIRGECIAGSSKECYDRYIEALNRAYNNDRAGRPKTIGFTGGGTGGYIPATGNVVNL